MDTTKQIHQKLKRLDPGQLQAVSDYIDLLLDTWEDEEDSQEAGDREGQANGQGGSSGWEEIKTIKGHQYRYLRWRQGGKLKSKYLGKAEEKA